MSAGREAVLMRIPGSSVSFDVGLEDGGEGKDADLVGKAVDGILQRDAGVEWQSQLKGGSSIELLS
jgi:hypothetical protein